MQIFDSKAIDYLMKLFRGTGDGNIVVHHDSSDPSRIRAKNNDGSIDLLVQNGGDRGIYDSTANNESWLIRTDGTDTYLPKGDVKIPGVVDPQTQALSGGNLETAGKVTANGGLETSSISASGGLDIQGSMEVSGAVHLHDTFEVDGNAEFNGLAGFDGLMYARGGIVATGDITATGNVVADGYVWSKDYLDSSGNVYVGGAIMNRDQTNPLKVYYGINASGYSISAGSISAGDVVASHELWSRNRLDVNGYIYNSSGNSVDVHDDLDVDGDAYADNFTQHSDERLKDIQGDVKLTIDDFANAPSVLFKFKNRKDEKLHGGTIAQYWQKIAPWAVSEDKDGYLSVSYANLALAGVIAIARFLKQYLTRLVKVENELAEMKKEMQQLRSKVNG